MGFICFSPNKCAYIHTFTFLKFPEIVNSKISPFSHAERWALAVLDALALQQGSTILSHSSGSLEELERHRIQLKDLVRFHFIIPLSISISISLSLSDSLQKTGKYDDAVYPEHES